MMGHGEARPGGAGQGKKRSHTARNNEGGQVFQAGARNAVVGLGGPGHGGLR